MRTSPLSAHYERLFWGPRGAVAVAALPSPPPPDHGEVDAAIRAAAGHRVAATPSPAPASSPPAPLRPMDGGARETSMPRKPLSANDQFNAWFRQAVQEVRGW